MIISAKSGFARGAFWVLGATPLIVGRSAVCDIVVDEAIVSRRQCKLWLENDALRLQNMGSQDTVRVNGKMMRDGILRVGDELAIGAALFSLSPDSDEARANTPVAAKPDTHTLSIAEFREQYMALSDKLDVHPRRQSDHMLVFQLSRMLAGMRSLEEVSHAVRQVLEARFPDAYLWIFQCQGETLNLITGAMKGIVQETITPLAQEALVGECATLNSCRDGLSQRGVMIAPLLAAGGHVGAIVLANDDNQPAFSEDDLVTYMAMAELTGPFLDSVVRTEEIANVNARLAMNADGGSRFIGISPTMMSLRAEVSNLANTTLNVLVFGESGTGKELVAHTLHELSGRKDEPLIAINCAAIPPQLFESELFGHTEGAFTGAAASKLGVFTRADGGTLFLDEVGDLSPENQAKLLRVVETGTFTPIGAQVESKVDVRIVSATNKELLAPEYREDLYHRLATTTVETVPLRTIPSDIPLLTRHFLDEIATRNNRLYRTLSEDALDYLCAQPWPGNGRELRNVVERAAQLSNKTKLTAKDFQRGERRPESNDDRRSKTLAEVEMEHIRYVLEQSGGNMKEAANTLGISRTTLYNKVPTRARRA